MNIYAGMFGTVLLRDNHEQSLGLPSTEHEIPLALSDRLLTAGARLYYPVSGNKDAPWVPEVLGDAMTGNRCSRTCSGCPWMRVFQSKNKQ